MASAVFICTKVDEQSLSTGYTGTKGLNRVQVQGTTVERNWTKYKYRVQLYKGNGQSTSTGYNSTKGLVRVGRTAQKGWAGLTEHLSVWLSQPINGSSAENVMIHCIGKEIQCGLQITKTRNTMQSH